MAGREAVLCDQLIDQAVGLILVLALLVLDYTALLVELALVNGAEEMAHAVGLHPQGDIEGRDRHVLKVIGAVLVGGAIQIGGADLLHGLEIIVIVVFAAVEHQVLEEMGETGLAGLFILGADMIPDIKGDDRGFMVLVDDDGEAVIEDEFLIGDFDLLGLEQGDHAGGEEQDGQQQGQNSRGRNEFWVHGTSLN
ncbi:MAG: hypothetical protein BWY77_01125 [bacterium ADurb.Bin431]|nr:MAG: hypothetical protein BWY77_01125 [bacterium ADurb.Bin431]